MRTLTVILPCYNEQENLPALLKSWFAIQNDLQDSGYGLSIVCVDDGSADDTNFIIAREAEKRPNVVLLTHEKNQGLGRALATGLLYFRERSASGDLALTMDSDNTHAPEYVFPMLARTRQGADCVIASRYASGASTRGVPARRLFLSDCARYYYSLVLNVKNVRDYTCGYRLYTFEIIKRALTYHGSDLITQNGFACMMELLYKLHTLDAAFAEVPFELRYDNKLGKSKMKLLKTIFYSLSTAARLRLRHKPPRLEEVK